MENDRIRELVAKYTDDVVAIRRDIHMHPELSMEEERTPRLVAQKLRELGLDVREHVGKRGVVGLLRGKKDGRTLLLRADMDALPIEEASDVPYRSCIAGVMHACGHDVHTAVLLGVAKVLVEMREAIKGNVKFVFQPAEECNPNSGAQDMIDDGVLEHPAVDAAAALHVWDLPVGTVGIKPGAMMAQSDRIYLEIVGRAAHVSRPHEGSDAIVAAAHIITALQTIVSRNIDPLKSAVISLSIINGGVKYNITPDIVRIEGSVRILDSSVAEIVPTRIQDICEGVAASLGCACKVNYVHGSSLTLNDEAMTTKAIGAFRRALGNDNVLTMKSSSLAGEDFSRFASHVPSVYFWLGISSEINEGRTTLHQPVFLVDERAIPTGMEAMASLAVEYLS